MLDTTTKPLSPTAASLASFHALRLAAHDLLTKAARLPSLPVLYAKQMEAAGALAGVELHRIHGQGCADDAMAIRADLELVARKVDPLIAAIGEELAENFNGVDRSLFEGQLFGALDGDAIFECDDAARRANEDQAEAREPRGSHRAYAREA